jgi:hypothetical protein
MKTNLFRGRSFLVLAVAAIFSSLMLAAAETPAKTKPAPAPNPTALWAKTKLELNRNISQINSILANPALREVGMDSLARQTGVAAATLEETRRKSPMSYGDLATALILASSSGVKLEQIKADRRARAWADIAVMRKVNLAGVNEKLKAVQTDVDKFIDKQEEDALKRDLAEQRRRMQDRGQAPPPTPPPTQQEPR